MYFSFKSTKVLNDVPTRKKTKRKKRYYENFGDRTCVASTFVLISRLIKILSKAKTHFTKKNHFDATHAQSPAPFEMNVNINF